MMENLKTNWLVVSKLTWGIWQILTQALENLKNLHFNGLLLNKVYNVWAKKRIGEFCLMTLNIDATFEGELTCAFKNDMRDLTNFHQILFGTVKIGTLMGSFHPKYKIYELKIYRGNLCHDNEEWSKDLKRNWLVSSKLTRGIWQILTRALKNLKNLHFNRLLLTKVCNAWAKKSIEELCLMALKLMQNLKETDLCFLKIFVYSWKNSDFIL